MATSGVDVDREIGHRGVKIWYKPGRNVIQIAMLTTGANGERSVRRPRHLYLLVNEARQILRYLERGTEWLTATTEETLEKMPIGNPNNGFFVEGSTYNGRRLLHIRHFWIPNGDGNWIATQRGVTLNTPKFEFKEIECEMARDMFGEFIEAYEAPRASAENEFPGSSNGSDGAGKMKCGGGVGGKRRRKA